MTIVEWGSLGELLGSLGVFITLVFLVVQIRQNTRAIEATSIQTVLDGYQLMNRAYFGTSPESPANRAIWTRGHARFSELPLDEQHVFHHMMADYVFLLQNVLNLRARKAIDHELFHAFSTHMLGAVGTPGGLKWWDTTRDYFTADVREYVDIEMRRLGRPLPQRELRDPYDWLEFIPHFRER
jgi:hypothetical protein